MKAKRILSLLLMVAMIATCMTAFAAPEGYVKVSTDNILSDGLVLAANAAKPSTDTIQINLTTEKVDDSAVLSAIGTLKADILAEYGVTMDSYDVLEELYGLDAGTVSGRAGKAYKLTATLVNPGTLVKSGMSSKTGFGIHVLDISFAADSTVFALMGATASSQILSDSACANGKVGTDFAIMMAGGPATAIPEKNGTISNTDITLAEIYVFAEEGVELEVKSALVGYLNFKAGSNTDANGTAWATTTYAPYVLETVTLGEVADDGDDNEGDDNEGSAPTIGETKTPETSTGIKVSDSKTYDNAMMATASVTINDATEVGILFIPDWVKAGGVIDWSKAAKATVSEDVIGNGGVVEVKAALIKIPRKYENDTINIVSKAYAQVGNETPVYGDEVTTALTFTNSGE